MIERIRPIFVVFLAVMLSLVMATDVFSIRGSGGEKKALIKPGASFPEIALRTPADKNDRAYLGIPEGRSFTIKDIKAELVLVEIMSVYCGACRRQAAIYNKLYALIESTPETKGRIKIVQIGIGDIEGDIKAFKEAFKVPSPIVPDTSFDMHKAIGSSDTPFSIFVRQDSTGKAGVVVKTHLGVEEKYKELFSEMKSLMKMDPAAIRKK
ncbi:MAG: TlpA family protein disulfide reductase [Desulfobacteraceae bacterium]|nr:TlpA family protein disulfide reductase [Desulfobacteraceae bacterium]